MERDNSIRILFASTVEMERQRFADLVAIKKLPYTLFQPNGLKDADLIMAENQVDIIITDTGFAGGAFADWLSLWPHPFIIFAYFGEEKRLDDLIRDEACSFLMRDSEYRHLGSLPTMIRKVLNIRESLNRQNVHLQISERRYLELVSSIPDIVYTLDGKGCFIYLNEAVKKLGYQPGELYGKHFSILLEEADVPKVSREIMLETLSGKATGDGGAPKLFNERRRGTRMTRNLEVRLIHKPPEIALATTARVDSYGEISCVGIVLPEYEGSEIGTVGIIRDITQRRKAESRLMEDLRLKEILLKEIHHRVKNNLQIVSSLLNLQCSAIEDVASREIFYYSQTQIQSMAMVHEQLYQSDDLQSIDAANYLTVLTAHLFRSYEVDSERVCIQMDCDHVNLSIDQAIPLALIVTELVSNSIKHGLARSSGVISVLLKHTEGDQLTLEVHDSGHGLPDGLGHDPLNSLGTQLVTALGEQLGGAFSWGARTARASLSDFRIFLSGVRKFFDKDLPGLYASIRPR